MTNILYSLRNSSRIWSTRSPRSKIAIGMIALAIPLALAGTYMASGGGNFEDLLSGRSALSAGAGASAGLASRLGAVGSDLLGVLGLRSPGERSQGQLADAKGRSVRTGSYVRPHHERALAKVRPPKAFLDQPFPVVTDNDVTSPAVTNALTPGTEVAAVSPGEQFGTGNNPGFGGGPGGGFIFPGGGGGGVGPFPPPTIPPPIVPPPTSAVPEPSTWALMLMGFWGIGASLRLPRRGPRGATKAIKAAAAPK